MKEDNILFTKILKNKDRFIANHIIICTLTDYYIKIKVHE